MIKLFCPQLTTLVTNNIYKTWSQSQTNKSQLHPWQRYKRQDNDRTNPALSILNCHTSLLSTWEITTNYTQRTIGESIVTSSQTFLRESWILNELERRFNFLDESLFNSQRTIFIKVLSQKFHHWDPFHLTLAVKFTKQNQR